MTHDMRSRPAAGERSHRQTVDRAAPREPEPVGGRAARLGAQVGSFVAIGIVSTLAYIVLYAALRSWLPAVAANAVALLVTAIGNTAANRRLTFGVRDRASMVRDQAAGLTAFAIALGITTGAVSLLAVAAPGAGRAVELVVLIVANVLATVVRFVLLRAWIKPRPATGPILATTDRLEGTPS
jgi:putative flippase GtrA